MDMATLDVFLTSDSQL